MFIVTLANYLNIINNKTINILEIIIPIISLLTAGYLMGKNATKNGWLEGIKIGLIIILIIFIINIIITHKIVYKNFVYYTILLISSTLGSMIGINKKI